MLSNIRKIFKLVISLLMGIFIFLYIFLLRIKQNSKLQQKPRLFWGPVPIKNWKYAAKALSEAGYDSKTVMSFFFENINEASDFDIYVNKMHEHLLLKLLPKQMQHLISYFFTFCFCLRRFDIFHLPLSGGLLSNTPLEKFEAQFLKFAGKKTIILSYGGDFYKYSCLVDTSLRHVLLESYPEMAKAEPIIKRRMDYWVQYADAIVGCLMTDGLGRWDMLTVNFATIDCTEWQSKQYKSKDKVTIVHTPNHRCVKGSEFIIRAVQDLQEEGLEVELLLLEKKQNREVMQIMREQGDILVDQLIFTAYGLSAIEGMATGLPVLANLENESYTRVFRRYSYLNECPILSTTPETIKENLRKLVLDSNLRKKLGIAGRQYVEKYHSFETARYIFENIYDKIWKGKNRDLMTLFHPLKSDYVKNNPISHPLIENHLPNDYFNKLNNKAFDTCTVA